MMVVASPQCAAHRLPRRQPVGRLHSRPCPPGDRGRHPFLDPSGYRSHLIFQLAQAHSGTPNLYKQYDFQLIYEHSAQAAAAATNPDYRYAYLPDDVDLTNPANNGFYKQAVVTAPLSPPIVSQDDWAQVPGELQSVVKAGDPLAN